MRHTDTRAVRRRADTGTDKRSRTSVNFTRLAPLHDALVARKHDYHREAADQRAPALVREDIREQRAAPAQVGAVGCHGRGHGIVATDADAKDDTEDGQPDERACGGKVACVREGGSVKLNDERGKPRRWYGADKQESGFNSGEIA